MRSRSFAAQHDAAVARRLELLTTELAAAREGGVVVDARVPPAAPWGPTGQGLDGAPVDLAVVPEAESRSEPLSAVAEPATPSEVRMPGRHAARRARGRPVGLPELVRGRVSLGPGQVVVVAVIGVLGLALTCWWLVRSAGHEVAAPTSLATPRDALVTPAAAVGSEATGTPSGAAKAKVVVDVTGRVRHPGIAVLRQGARVIDAVRAAGGVRPGTDLSGLNLARVLADGEQIVVGHSAATAPVSTAGPSGAPSVGLVNINTADQTALEALPEVGPVTAQAIIAWRTENGGFSSVDQLLDVDGIGDATLDQLTPYVTV